MRLQQALLTWYRLALEAGGGKPLETLSPKDARAVLTGAQASVKVDVAGIEVERRSIQVDGKPLDIRVIRPEGATGDLPVFMFFHGGGGLVTILLMHASSVT